MKIAFLLYPTAKIKIEEDSSFWIMFELRRRGHEVFYFESKDLLWRKRSVQAYLTPARLDRIKGYLVSPKNGSPSDLSDMDCIFIRKEPPFDTQYLAALQLLEIIKNDVFILNDPAGLAISNEKTFSLIFGKYTPETLVTQDPGEAKKFISQLKKAVVIKPLDEKGGVGIFSSHSKDKNLASILDAATQFSKKTVLIQRFIPEGKFGDKRILILDGKPLGAFVRRPPAYDFRANLSVGGSMHGAKLTAWDEKLVEFMSAKLISRGIYFSGIDVIGKYVTEINVTSPAGIPEINHFNKTHLERNVADFIEKTVSSRIRFLK